jgi:hypothetical protein
MTGVLLGTLSSIQNQFKYAYIERREENATAVAYHKASVATAASVHQRKKAYIVYSVTKYKYKSSTFRLESSICQMFRITADGDCTTESAGGGAQG